MSIVRMPRVIPKTLREWDRVFEALNEVIRDTGSGIEVDALNLPSQTAPYITSGTATGLPSSRKLSAKTGETTVVDTGSTIEVSLVDVGTPGTYPKVVTDTKGRVVAGAPLQTSDMPAALQRIYSGVGTPNGVVVATPGALYLNQSGGANVTLWVKESGSSNTGWVAK